MKGKQVLLGVTHGMCIESRDLGFQNCGCVLKWLTLEATKSVTNPEMLGKLHTMRVMCFHKDDFDAQSRDFDFEFL